MESNNEQTNNMFTLETTVLKTLVVPLFTDRRSSNLTSVRIKKYDEIARLCVRVSPTCGPRG
jgi:hypothetical protein